MFEVLIGDRVENFKGGPEIKTITPIGQETPSEWSVSLKPLERPTIKLKNDMEVDVFDTEKCWKRGAVKDILSGKAMVEVEGKSISYSFEDIKLCGSRVKTIKCKSGGPTAGQKVTFQPSKINTKPESYLPDSGTLADFHGEEHMKFGWSNENELNCVSNDDKIKTSPLTSAGCFFVPHREAKTWKKYGLGQENENNWHMEVPNGTFRVMVTLGSPSKET
jgi:hypothetical protein